VNNKNFELVTMSEDTRKSRKIDLPSQAYIPSGLPPDSHLKCAYSRVNGRFPALTYFSQKFEFAIWRGSQPAYDT
jgi:hypothetical protein